MAVGEREWGFDHSTGPEYSLVLHANSNPHGMVIFANGARLNGGALHLTMSPNSDLPQDEVEFTVFRGPTKYGLLDVLTQKH